MVHSRTACSKASTLKKEVGSPAAGSRASTLLRLPTTDWSSGWPAGCLSPLNPIRLSEARLHAVSSRNMYSEHGLEARIGPALGAVCQSLMVLWNWMPGSADCHAA